jgi:hypothetical protein
VTADHAATICHLCGAEAKDVDIRSRKPVCLGCAAVHKWLPGLLETMERIALYRSQATQKQSLTELPTMGRVVLGTTKRSVTLAGEIFCVETAGVVSWVAGEFFTATMFGNAGPYQQQFQIDAYNKKMSEGAWRWPRDRKSNEPIWLAVES